MKRQMVHTKNTRDPNRKEADVRGVIVGEAVEGGNAVGYFPIFLAM